MNVARNCYYAVEMIDTDEKKQVYKFLILKE